jgi:carbon monoxide dehydrogenase subunit G
LKIGGSYSIPADRGRAYVLLQDPVVLARCMPGCDHLALIGDNEYEMKMKVVISSINGLFAGKVRIADQNPPETFRLIVEGSGKVGFLKGDGLLHLEESEGLTEVRYDGEVHVGGMMAQVGQRLIDSTAKMVIKRFFEKLTAEATAASQAGEAAAAGEAGEE